MYIGEIHWTSVKIYVRGSLSELIISEKIACQQLTFHVIKLYIVPVALSCEAAD